MKNAEAPPNSPLVCIRCIELPKPPMAVQVDTCSLCGWFVWVSLSSPKTSVLWCWECAGREIAKADDPQFAVTDEQLKDVIEHFDWEGRES